VSRQRNQQQAETSQTPAFRTIDASSGVSFSDGVMHVNGQPQRPANVVHWEASNGYTNYTTVEWVDPFTGDRRTSCNCPGWANKRRGQPRGCCHTADMEGIRACNRKRVDTTAITTMHEALEAIPDIREGRALRGILLD
jgi:hypothetical protein